MKTNKPRLTKEQKQELKQRHRLEYVMQESGERFEADAGKPNLWRSTTTPGLVVDIDRQTFAITSGRDIIESGDVFTWLIYRNRWTFPQAIRFLQKRRPDPKRSESPRPAKAKTFDIIREDEETKPFDRWQKKALEIAGERIRKYFSWTWYSLTMYREETRIEPTHAPDVTHCGRCGNRINWQMEKLMEPVEHGYRLVHAGPIPVIAYSIKHRMKPGDFGIESDEFVEALDGLFVKEDDDVVCTACAWSEYDFLIALEYVKTSAYWREDAEDKKRENENEEDY